LQSKTLSYRISVQLAHFLKVGVPFVLDLNFHDQVGLLSQQLACPQSAEVFLLLLLLLSLSLQ